jgi:hypothetical protein
LDGADGWYKGGEFTPVVKLGIIAVSDGEEKEDVVYRQYVAMALALLFFFPSQPLIWICICIFVGEQKVIIIAI